jgi:hypothetical protein
MIADLTTIADTTEKIAGYQLLTFKAMLKLESLGMKHSKGSVAPTIRQMIGSKTRDKKALLAEYVNFLKSHGFLE